MVSLRLVWQEPGVSDACPSPAPLKAGGVLAAGEVKRCQINEGDTEVCRALCPRSREDCVSLQ